MDGLKLTHWQERFLSGAQAVKVQYDSYFRSKPFNDCFALRHEESSGILTLEITDPDMPREIKRRLEELLIASKPEDSI